ncbi:unannotated protein [freshwater metagenome]|uniref:Unannotated protein n=1 Tax=freshwater metagenome TaxID=449393 RepID=A0A6J5ZXN1_9ZZZZ
MIENIADARSANGVSTSVLWYSGANDATASKP